MKSSLWNTIRAVVVTAGLLGGPAVAAADDAASDDAVDYVLDPGEGRLYVLVRYERGTFAGALGHDHVVVATGWSGTATWSAADPTACAIDVAVPVTGLVVDPGSSRSWAGLEGSTPDRDKQTITENLRSDGQLDASAHPSVRFEARRCDRDGTVHGRLSIRGVGADVAVPMDVHADGATLTAQGRFSVAHSDFGIRPFRALGGMLRNDDRLEFVVDVRGTRAAP